MEMSKYARNTGLLGALLVGVAALIVGCQPREADTNNPRAHANSARETSSTSSAAQSGSAAHNPGAQVAFSAHEIKRIAELSPLPEPPVDKTNAVVQDPRAAHLGQFLFFDTRLSANNEVSCATCHQPEHGFSAPTQLGHGLKKTPRHPPSLLNAVYYPWFDWDGRVDSIWAQAFGPLESPLEMGFSRTKLAHLMAQDDELRAAYENIFGPMPDLSDAMRFPPIAHPVADAPNDPASLAWQKMRPEDRKIINRIATNTTKAIAAYVARLVRGDAPFDRFVAKLTASGTLSPVNSPVNSPAADTELSPQAQRGLKLFVGKAGCIRCHVGANFSDDSFHNLGLGPRDWLTPESPDGAAPPANALISGDSGRYKGVSQVKSNPFNAASAFSDTRDGKKAKWLHYLHQTSEDRGQFKTPTLRNIALSPPYMHGGHFDTLKEVVHFYSLLNEQVQIGHREDMLVPIGLTDAEEDELVAFLKSLSGAPLPPELLHPPATPIAVSPAHKP